MGENKPPTPSWDPLQVCGHCRYWGHPNEGLADLNHCHRRSPVVGFTLTDFNDWCGEWAERGENPFDKLIAGLR